MRGLSGDLRPRQDVTLYVTRGDGTKTSFTATARLDDTPVEIGYYQNGVILRPSCAKRLRA